MLRSGVIIVFLDSSDSKYLTGFVSRFEFRATLLPLIALTHAEDLRQAVTAVFR